MMKRPYLLSEQQDDSEGLVESVFYSSGRACDHTIVTELIEETDHWILYYCKSSDCGFVVHCKSCGKMLKKECWRPHLLNSTSCPVTRLYREVRDLPRLVGLKKKYVAEVAAGLEVPSMLDTKKEVQLAEGVEIPSTTNTEKAAAVNVDNNDFQKEKESELYENVIPERAHNKKRNGSRETAALWKHNQRFFAKETAIDMAQTKRICSSEDTSSMVESWRPISEYAREGPKIHTFTDFLKKACTALEIEQSEQHTAENITQLASDVWREYKSLPNDFALTEKALCAEIMSHKHIGNNRAKIIFTSMSRNYTMLRDEQQQKLIGRDYCPVPNGSAEALQIIYGIDQSKLLSIEERESLFWCFLNLLRRIHWLVDAVVAAQSVSGRRVPTIEAVDLQYFLCMFRRILSGKCESAPFFVSLDPAEHYARTNIWNLRISDRSRLIMFNVFRTHANIELWSSGLGDYLINVAFTVEKLMWDSIDGERVKFFFQKFVSAGKRLHTKSYRPIVPQTKWTDQDNPEYNLELMMSFFAAADGIHEYLQQSRMFD